VTCIVGIEHRSEQEQGGTFLVGLADRLYVVHSDFQIARSADGYAAVGSGDDIALGSLHGTRGRAPRWRINAALSAAAHHSSVVTPPFVVEMGR
jgi:hypothetical protein